MHNLLTPLYARKQTQQRWLYSAIACVCVALGLVQLRHAFTTTPTVAESVVTQPLNAMPEPTTLPVIPKPAADEPSYDMLTNTTHEPDKPDPCADLIPPDYQIAAVLWQQQGELLVLRTPLGRHLQITLGHRLEQSEWVLQSIDNHTVVWRHQRLFCNVAQAIKALPKQLL